MDETEYVTKVYDIIAPHFDLTRGYLWKGVKDYLRKIEPGSSILDAGCGNGKNMLSKFAFTGLDSSIELAKIARNKTGFKVDIGSVTEMPYPDESFDHVICIAVIHHLNSDERRIKSIAEIARVMKKNGTGLISVWELTIGDDIRGQKNGLVKWTNQSKTGTYQRYYHLFEKNELESLANKVPGITITNSFWEHDNFYIEICKKE
jgi:ubiquinone/menaquinone biosynthesis C-methylase UbiE